MAAHRIQPPCLPELRPGQLATLLAPMPVPASLIADVRVDSDEAIVMAVACGVPISENYRFQQQRED